MSDEEIKMEAEPAVYYNGELVSDESEHAEWLDNPKANRMADALAMEGIEKSLTLKKSFHSTAIWDAPTWPP
jgi:hypothetical protein